MYISPKISVIIPAYNVSKYIGQCVDSILNQSYENIEVIVVDDGSSDNTIDILRDRAKDQRLIIIQQKNSGVSEARNTGIRHSSGEFITFCDSDDYLAPNHISTLYDLLNVNQDCHLAITSDYNLFEPEGRLRASSCDEGIYESTELVNRMLNHQNDNLLAAVWNKLFIGSVIRDNAIFFNSGLKYGEDWLFVIDYLRHIDKVVMSNKPTYYYRKYEGERLSTTFNDDGYLKAIEVRKILAKWFPIECGGDNYHNTVVKIAQINLSQYARKRGLKHFVDFSKKIFNNKDIIDSCESLSKTRSGKVIAFIRNRNFHKFLIWCFISYAKQFTRHYIAKILRR